MSERGFNRLNKAQLATAQPKSLGKHGANLVHVPEAEEGSRALTPFKFSKYSKEQFPHVYSNADEPTRATLQEVHSALTGVQIGTKETIADQMGFWMGRWFRDDVQFAKSGLYERADQIRDDYIDIIATDRREHAGRMSRVLQGSNVYVVAADSQNLAVEPPYYAARVNEIVNLRSGDGMQFEPVVSTPDGEGLLPKDMWLFQGIYVPTSSQDLDWLKDESIGQA